MRNAKGLFILFLIVSLFPIGCASNGFLFKASYAPNHIYRMETSTQSKLELDLLGNAQLVANLKDKGIQLPMHIDSSQRLIASIETEQNKPDGSLPASITYEKVDFINKMNNKEMNLGLANKLEGLKIYANVINGNKVEIERFEGGDIDENMKKVIPQVIENIQKSIKYPEKPLKIGDKFTQEIPIQIPIPGFTTVDIKIISNYELRRVEKNLAYFDVVQEIKMLQADPKYKMELSGNGGGTLVHDLIENFSIEFNSNYIMFLTMNHDEILIRIKAISESKYHVAINKK
jgi:hypothetical protein